ncbi:MAG: glycosyltransferase family 39 protein, partial [Candidatus Doudnabacteria bacterium]|nr:glycosyltransferase family 39 protein [Candidatus Doudnabacteria bacterium]
ITGIYLYKLTFIITKNKLAGFVTAFVFIANPNILYLQSTPMTELPLLAFFLLSSYYFIRFILSESNFNYILLAALFGFCATLTRYDGWFLVIVEAAVMALVYFPIKFHWYSKLSKIFYWDRFTWQKLQGHVVLFASLAFFGIVLWLAWGYLILGDPLYFTHSEFSAKSQQQSWLARGELPAYHHIGQSITYYTATTWSNIGSVVFLMAMVGCAAYLFDRKIQHRWLLLIILSVPFVFNVVTLFLGQSVIFIPQVTASNFEWNLFNVRYGVMMVPLAAFAVGYLFYKVKPAFKVIVALALVAQASMYPFGIEKVISYEDGVAGLSSASAKIPTAQYWVNDHYDHGLVLVDDFARTLSIVRTSIPMQNMIYVGNKPYWDESLKAPEKYARWIIMQKDDAVWKSILDDQNTQDRLYKYFEKTYTSPEILVFRRNDKVAAE